MVKKVNALNARKKLGQLLEEVYYKGDQFVIERAGRPMAAVVPVWQLEERATRKERLFRMVGEVVELPERHFDAITAVSGSGPAYLFFIAQAWEQAAVSLGLPAAVAGSAIRQTLRGSLRLLEASSEPAAALIAKVASKGGTTEAALKMFARRHVAEHFGEALRAAAHRSKELSWS